MSSIDSKDDGWIKSSFSPNENACVEFHSTPGGADMRDSKNKAGAVLHFTKAEIKAMIQGAKAGEFDHLFED